MPNSFINNLRENIPKPLRSSLRKFGARLGLMKDWEAEFARRSENQGEQGAGWYDEIYAESESYKVEYYESPYYALWMVILDRIRRDELQSVLEVGCGSGQFACLLRSQGINDYTGFDFSSQAIQIAKTLAPEMRFEVSDAFKTKLFDEEQYDIIVCTEVLEHVEADLELLERIPSGTRCLCTVPNFPHHSHVRFFQSAEEVQQRYASLFENCDVLTLKGIRNKDELFFLIDGIKR